MSQVPVTLSLSKGTPASWCLGAAPAPDADLRRQKYGRIRPMDESSAHPEQARWAVSKGGIVARLRARFGR